MSNYGAFSVLLCLVLALPGCGSDDKARWQDASGAQAFFSEGASRAALSDSSVEQLSTRCEALLPTARAALDEPGSAGLRVLIQACAQQQLGFGGEVRCVDDSMQVRCQ